MGAGRVLALGRGDVDPRDICLLQAAAGRSATPLCNEPRRLGVRGFEEGSADRPACHGRGCQGCAEAALPPGVGRVRVCGQGGTERKGACLVSPGLRSLKGRLLPPKRVPCFQIRADGPGGLQDGAGSAQGSRTRLMGRTHGLGGFGLCCRGSSVLPNS